MKQEKSLKERLRKIIDEYKGNWAYLCKNKEHKKIVDEVREATKFTNKTFRKRVYLVLSDTINLAICSFCNKREQVINEKGYMGRCGHSQCRTDFLKINGIPYFSEKSTKKRIKNTDWIKFGENVKKRHWTYTKESDKVKEKMRKNWSERTKKQIKDRKEKYISTMMEKYGVKSSLVLPKTRIKTESSKVRKIVGDKNREAWKNKSEEEKHKHVLKISKTYKERTGYDHPLQNPKVRKQMLRKSFLTTKVNENLFCQGSYEKDFVEKYLYKFPSLVNAKSVRYFFNGKDHIYFPDFFIKELNLVIEIKSTWTFDENGKNIELRNKNFAKWKAVKNEGYEFIMIMNKNYEKFESLTMYF